MATSAVAEMKSVERPAWPDMWGADAKGAYFIGSRCSKCRGLTLGRRELCPHCLASGTMQEERIGRRGTLYSATVVHQTPRGFSGPYRIGYVDVGEGVRVFAHIADGDAGPRIGGGVELAIGQVKTADDGGELTGPVYHALGRTA